MPGWGAAPTNRYAEPGANPYGSPYGAVHDPKRKYKRGALMWSALGGAVVAFVAGIALVVVLALAFAGDNTVVATHPRVTEGARIVQVGECLSASPSDAVVIDQSQRTNCNQTHGSEVVGIVTLPDASSYPRSGDLGDFADAACAIPFRSYVGQSPDDSDVESGSIPPSRAAFDDGDRRVWCLADSATYDDGHGTVRNSGG